MVRPSSGCFWGLFYIRKGRSACGNLAVEFTMERHQSTSNDDRPHSEAVLTKDVESKKDSLDTPGKSIFNPDLTTNDEDTDYYSRAPTPNSPATTRANLANENVAPFLARHIPEQYAPLGSRPLEIAGMSRANSKFCYRHRPDLKCRRQADEPSMDKLQRVCLSGYSPKL